MNDDGKVDVEDAKISFEKVTSVTDILDGKCIYC